MIHNPTTIGRGPRAGFTLLEVLVAISVMSLLAAIVAANIWAMVRIERADAALFHRAITIGTVADQFRADVGQAAGVPENFEAFKKASDCLILKGVAGKHVVYHWDGKRLERIERAAPHQRSKTEQRRFLALPNDIERVDFGVVTNEKRLLKLELRQSQPAYKVSATPATEILAALGGDKR